MMIASVHLLAESQIGEIIPAMDTYSDGLVIEWWNTETLERLTQWGVVLVRRAPALRILCQGIGPDINMLVAVPAYEQPRYSQTAYPQGYFLHNPVPLLFPLIDFCSIVGIVISLMAVVFTYDAITGEKQRGTLKLVLSGGVPRYRLLVAKWLGAFSSFLIGYIPGLLIVLLYMELHPGISLSALRYISILAIDVLSILYAACFFSLGIFVSCRCRDPKTSLLSLLLLWALLVLIIPSVSAYLGAMLRPAPAPYEMTKQVELIAQEARARTSDRMTSYENQQKLIPSEGQSEQHRIYRNQIVWEEIQSVYGRASRVWGIYAQKLRKQIQLSKTISCFSPLPPFVYLATDGE